MNSKRRGLGRGLDALLGGREGPAPGPELGVQEVGVTRLRPNARQPRTEFDEAELESLTESVRSQGIIQPIVVTRSDTADDFMILAGERRWRAAQRAGLTQVPVVVRTVDSEQQRLELALVENLQRSDLNPVEEAEAYQALRSDFGLSQAQIATQVGKARTTVTNSLRLLRLPEPVQQMLRDGELSPGQARPLLALSSAERQAQLAERAVREGLSARDLEALVQGKGKTGPSSSTKAKPTDVHQRAAEERLTQALQTKVEIRRRGEGGTLRIHFHSEQELMRLYETMVGSGASRSKS